MYGFIEKKIALIIHFKIIIAGKYGNYGLLKLNLYITRKFMKMYLLDKKKKKIEITQKFK